MQYLLLLPRGFVASAVDSSVFSDPSYSSGQVVNGGGDRLRVRTPVSGGSLMVVVKSLPLSLKYDSLLEMPWKNINEGKRRGGNTGQKEKAVLVSSVTVDHHVGNLGVHYSYSFPELWRERKLERWSLGLITIGSRLSRERPGP